MGWRTGSRTEFNANYITSIMTNERIGVIVVTVRKESGHNKSRKEKIMATVNFAADARAVNGFAAIVIASYLNSEYYETLYSKGKEQSLVMVRSCRVRKRRKLRDSERHT